MYVVQVRTITPAPRAIGWGSFLRRKDSCDVQSDGIIQDAGQGISVRVKSLASYNHNQLREIWYL